MPYFPPGYFPGPAGPVDPPSPTPGDGGIGGPLARVDTLVAAINLNVSRMLYMESASLQLCIPDENELDGVRVIRQYDTNFDRMTEVEREIGDGATVIVDIADYGFDLGQLRADITEAKYIRFVLSGVPTELLELNDVPSPAFNEAQVYRLTSGVVTFKQTYMRVGR